MEGIKTEINFITIYKYMFGQRSHLEDKFEQNSTHKTSYAHYHNQRTKKPTLHHKNQTKLANATLHSHEKDLSSVQKSQIINSSAIHHIASIATSANKLSKQKNKSISHIEPNAKTHKHKINKHTSSVLNLAKNTQDCYPKVSQKGSAHLTKRKQSGVDLSQKIKEKTKNFKVLAHCLEVYVDEEKKTSQNVNIHEIIKLIKAFNKSEVAGISKPLENLILEIINSIQNSLPSNRLKQEENPSHIKSILKKSQFNQFSSPATKPKATYKCNTEQNQSSEIKNYGGTSTVKKYAEINQFKKTKGFDEFKSQSEKKQLISADVSKLEENLQKLKYESNKLHYFFEEITCKSKNSNKKGVSENESMDEVSRKDEVKKLKNIIEEQAKIIEELESDGIQEGNSSSETFRNSEEIPDDHDQ